MASVAVAPSATVTSDSLLCSILSRNMAWSERVGRVSGLHQSSLGRRRAFLPVLLQNDIGSSGSRGGGVHGGWSEATSNRGACPSISTLPLVPNRRVKFGPELRWLCQPMRPAVIVAVIPLQGFDAILGRSPAFPSDGFPVSPQFQFLGETRCQKNRTSYPFRPRRRKGLL